MYKVCAHLEHKDILCLSLDTIPKISWEYV
jgi:hypothetical protein